MINITTFDCLNGKEIKAFTLKNENIQATVLNYGGIIQSFKVFDKTDIVLGFDDIDGYVKYDTYAGAVVGRVANVIENATYTLDGETFTLTKNAGKHCNHSGLSGFDKVIFDYQIDGEKLILSTLSKDGDGGFGGNMNFKVEYLLNGNDFTVKFTAKSDKKTPFAPTVFCRIKTVFCVRIHPLLYKFVRNCLQRYRLDFATRRLDTHRLAS